MAKNAANRPYEYIAPELTDVRCKNSIDLVVNHYGMNNEAEIKEKAIREQNKKNGSGSRPRGKF